MKNKSSKKNLSINKNTKTVMIVTFATLVTLVLVFALFFTLKNHTENRRAQRKDFDMTLEQLVTNMNNAKDVIPQEYQRDSYIRLEDFIRDKSADGTDAPSGIKYNQFFCELEDGYDMIVLVNAENNRVAVVSFSFDYSDYSAKSVLAFGLQAQTAMAIDDNMSFDSFIRTKDRIDRKMQSKQSDFYINSGINSYGGAVIDDTVTLYVWAGKSYFAYGEAPTTFVKPEIETTTEPITEPITAPVESNQTTEQSIIEGGSITFADALSINSDVVAWLTIYGTNITGPILQTGNNNYYLNHTIYGKYSRFGSRFADFRCNLDPQNQSQNITVYGHYSDEGVIFAKLHKYKDLDFFKSHSTIEFCTPTEFAQYKVFAVFAANTESAQGPVFEYRDPEFATQESFLYFIERVMRRTMIVTNVDVQENDKILTLSTCTREIPNCRLVVMARKVRPGESPIVDTSQIGYAANPLYPKAWYKTKYGKNLTKPYYEDEY